jgi:S-DNA-T family DNA segregation ATPase FtsK/SpoIIIE
LPLLLRLLGTHLLVAGASGAGKGSVLSSLIRALAPLVYGGSVELWVIDPKGGMEMTFGRALFARFEDTDYEGMAAMLEEAAPTWRRGRSGSRARPASTPRRRMSRWW